MLEPYAGQLARTVLRGPGRSQDFPGYPTLETNTFAPLCTTCNHQATIVTGDGAPNNPIAPS
jgi:hypothetical protein